ncbi:membrane-associated phospholipid phosphatase [Streptomyces sp. B4I13]|uniref:Membrane-associated phospholipid phosphatase n=1 Tax=Streptomyces achromogenes TaxID=67255 RepID=A0ABU0PWR4_STRAH|nr:MULTISPECIES: phosphatase PAP2 family protein [Streptomyces]MDQ0682840.1 membrane-associated phospholipid phosphatase [Streptomyces achromogenes]MDQ0830040.1 membrane-associated phospholipid phosphatase [Streptomyces achromogenes]MDQ0962865.1 membrane-associated phospholipid phosphatase [Streptomyces sp. B4I13]
MRTEQNLTRLDRVFARLDREPERPAHIDVPKMSRHRVALLVATLAFYLAIVWLVVVTSWLVRFDWQVMFFRPYQQWPEIHAFLDYYVVLGQRGPTAVMVAAWLGWRSWRQHTLRPLLTLGASLLLLNITVGAAKLGMGRLGPHYATTIGSNEMGLGGDIFPSGHTANAVVTWGILAYLASTPRARRWLSAVSAVVSLGVGLTTVYLGTHWLSDVVLGWAAGLLVLLALPWCEPLIARAEVSIFALRDRLRERRSGTFPVPAAPVAVPVSVAAGAAASSQDEAAAPRETATAARPPRAPVYLAPGPHTTRSERTPVTPAGSRRPPHADRLPRGATTSTARPLTGG